ncbi:MAG: hypothetical protein IJT44_04590 [Clostridia bacterium]|nr:hypothetical protein [Clostridia bacterium]
MHVLGLDIGTTTICAVVLDSDSGAVLCSRTLPNDTRIEGLPYEKLQSPMQILNKCRTLVQQLHEAYTLGAIGVTGQMHGILYYDKSGNSVSPLFTWQDESGNRMATDTQTYSQLLREKSGYKAASGFGGCTYFVHSLTGRVPAGAVGVCTIHDFVAMHLAGRKRPLSHVSDAASLGLFDLKTLEFDRGAIAEAGLDDFLFPAVTADFAVIGQYADNVPVACAVGDNQASFLGSVRDMPGSVLCNIGTGGQVSFLTDYADVPGTELRPCFGDRYIRVGASLCGGRAFALLEAFLRSAAELVTGEDFDNVYGAMDRYLAQHEPPDDPLDVDTRFCGTRESPLSRGVIGNVGVGNFTAEHLLYGVLHGIAAELFAFYDSAPHGERTTLVCSGNGLRKNPALRQEFARQFGMRTVLPDHREEAAFGAALFAMTACGVTKTIYEAGALIQYEKE